MGSSKIDSFLNSIDISLKKRKYLGDRLNTSVIKLLGDLLFMLDTIKEKFETSSNPLYENRIICIEDKIKYLIENCDTLCNNSNPTIENNTINLTLQDIQESKIIPFEEIVKNYFDQENNEISDILFHCLEGDFKLKSGDNKVKIDCPVSKTDNFSISLEDDEYTYFVKNNTNTDPCTGELVKVDNSFLEQNLDLNILDVKDINGDFILQKIEIITEFLPNDSIIYVHVDTTSMGSSDINYLNNLFLVWWTNYQANNPNFAGSFIMNTQYNSILSTNYAAGRGNNGVLNILNSPFSTISSVELTEYWLKNPLEGMLRQAYKEGENDFIDMNSFYDWVNNKSLILLSFIDESEPMYHSKIRVDRQYPGYVDTVLGTSQPTQEYLDDYNEFVNNFHSKLKLFKGTLYPIIRLLKTDAPDFLLQSISAIEAVDLTEPELEVLVGTHIKDELSFHNTYRDRYFTIASELNNNPYKPYNQLKGKGWQGIYTGYSPVYNIFTSSNIDQQMGSLLEITEQIETLVTSEVKIPVSYPKGKFCLSVIDDDCDCPLTSNQAEIDLSFNTDCLTTPLGGNNIVFRKPIPCNTIDYIGEEILPSDVNEFLFKITSIDFNCHKIYFMGVELTSSSLPIVINRDQIQSGNLQIENTGTDCDSIIKYFSAFPDGNYSNTEDIVVLGTYCV